MMIIEIEGQQVEVDDAFAKMSPEQQAQEVDMIGQQLSITPQSRQEPQPEQPLDDVKFRPNVTATDQSQFTPEQLKMGRRFRERGGEEFQLEQFAAERPIASKAAKFLQGVPFGGEFADETAGVISSNPQATNIVRAMQEREERENPIGSAALQIGGGLAAALPAAAIAAPSVIAAAPKTMLGKIALGVPVGAVFGGAEGAVSGFGAGTDQRSRKDEALFRGAVGTGLGATFGVAAPPLAKGAEKLVSFGANLINRLRAPAAVSDISQPAKEIIGRALSGEGQSAQASVNLARGGEGAMLADATQGTRDLLDASIARSGQGANVGKAAVESRVFKANQNMRTTLDDVLGAPEGVKAAETAIRKGTAAARNKAYTDAYSTPIDYSGEGGIALEGLLRRVPKSAFKVANKLMRVDGVSSRQQFKRLDAAGNVVESRTLPDVRQIDYLTRGLREVAERQEGKGKLGGTSQLGRAFGNLSTEIRTLTRRLAPAYGNALDTAADPISRRLSLKQGEKFLSPALARDEAQEIVQGLSGAGELRALQQGIRSNIDNKMANVRKIMSDPNQDARQALSALNELSTDAARQKMSMILPPEQQQKLFREIDRSTLGFELRAAVAANSKTAIRQATQRAVDDFATGGTIRQAASGQPVLSVKRVFQLLTKNTPEDKLAREDQLYGEIVNVLTQSRGADARVLLRTLSAINLREPIRAGMAKRVGNIIGSGAAVIGQQSGTRAIAQ